MMNTLSGSFVSKSCSHSMQTNGENKQLEEEKTVGCVEDSATWIQRNITCFSSEFIDLELSKYSIEEANTQPISIRDTVDRFDSYYAFLSGDRPTNHSPDAIEIGHGADDRGSEKKSIAEGECLNYLSMHLTRPPERVEADEAGISKIHVCEKEGENSRELRGLASRKSTVSCAVKTKVTAKEKKERSQENVPKIVAFLIKQLEQPGAKNLRWKNKEERIFQILKPMALARAWGLESKRATSYRWNNMRVLLNQAEKKSYICNVTPLGEGNDGQRRVTYESGWKNTTYCSRGKERVKVVREYKFIH